MSKCGPNAKSTKMMSYISSDIKEFEICITVSSLDVLKSFLHAFNLKKKKSYWQNYR